MGIQLQYSLSLNNLLLVSPSTPKALINNNLWYRHRHQQQRVLSGAGVGANYSSLNGGVVIGVKYYDPLVSKNKKRTSLKVVASSSSASSGNVGAPTSWDTWSPDKATPSPCLSDVLWPSIGKLLSFTSF